MKYPEWCLVHTRATYLLAIITTSGFLLHEREKTLSAASRRGLYLTVLANDTGSTLSHLFPSLGCILLQSRTNTTFIPL